MLDDIRCVLKDALQLGPGGDRLTDESPLLGAIPEFDSMAVIAVIGLIEERFGCEVHDDEISADVFMTVGSLRRFVEEKVGA